MTTTVSVHASDPVSRTGVAAQLVQQPDIELIDPTSDADVAVVVADNGDEEAARIIRALRRSDRTRVVAVVARADDAGVVALVEAGASGLLRRQESDSGALIAAIRAAAVGEGALPPDLLGRLLRQVGQLQRQVLRPRGLSWTGLSDRERQVLRLVANGMSTSEIARQLSYSERTIKNVIQDVVSRFQLRNRSHAVAFAVREGLI